MTDRNSSSFGKILVTGATGNVGGLLIPKLLDLGADVRALVRDEARVQGLKDAGVELVVGDLDQPETLDAAFQSVDKVFLIKVDPSTTILAASVRRWYSCTPPPELGRVGFIKNQRLRRQGIAALAMTGRVGAARS